MVGQLTRQCLKLCRAWADREIDGHQLAERAFEIGIGNGVDFSHTTVREHDRRKHQVRKAGQVELSESRCG